MNLSIYGMCTLDRSIEPKFVPIRCITLINLHFTLFRFNWLPVTEDEEESPHVYGYLCDLIQANHPIVLGANNSNLPRIVCIIAEALYRSVIDPTHEVGRRMLEIVKQVEQSPDVFQVCISALSADQKSALEDAYRELAAAAVAAAATVASP